MMLGMGNSVVLAFFSLIPIGLAIYSVYILYLLGKALKIYIDKNS